MKVLILGGTRFFGKATAELFLGNDYFSTTKTLSRTALPGEDHRHIICDRKNTSELRAIFRAYQPNVIVDTVNFAEDDSEGMVKAYNMGDLRSLSHYIVASSFFVYNYFDPSQFNEKRISLCEVNSQDVDGYTYRKMQMETSLYDSELMALTTILRLPFVFASDDYSGRFQELCDISTTHKKPKFSDSYRYSMISKDFAARGIEYLAKRPPQGIVDFANSGCVSSEEIVQTISSSSGQGQIANDNRMLNSPYVVNRDICIGTNKIELHEDLKMSLKAESEKYFFTAR